MDNVKRQETLFIRALKRERTDRVPIWCMRQAGRYLPEYREVRARHKDFLGFCYHSEDAAEVTLQPIRRFGLDAAILFADILVVPDALGADVRFVAGEGPVLGVMENVAQVAALSLERAEQHWKPVLETVKLLRERLPQEVALIGFAGAPWTLACYMLEGKGSRDFAKARMQAFRQPEMMLALMELLTEATFRYLRAQILAGAQAVQLFDSWAGVLPEQDYLRWVVQPNRQIVTRLKQEFPRLPVIGFAKGSGALYPAYVEQVPVDAIGVDASTPLLWAKQQLQPNVVLQGNLDNVLFAENMEAAIAQVDAILECWSDGPMVMNLGHGVLPHTPPEHMARLVEHVQAFRRQEGWSWQR